MGGAVLSDTHISDLGNCARRRPGRGKRLGSVHVVRGTPKDSDRAWGALKKARRTQCV